MKQFKGKTAVITGGASGIGRAIADRFAREGTKIVLADIEQPALDVAVEEMKSAGAQVIGIRVDVANLEQIQDLARRASETFGHVHILCNNAGVANAGAASWEQSEKDWQWVMGVNLWSVVYAIRTFVPAMIEHGEEGHVVNISSLAGLFAMPMAAPYHVSKFGVVALTESLYYEFAMRKANLGASVACPAWVKTRILEAARNRPPQLRDEVERPETADLTAAFRERIEKQGLEPSFIAGRVFDAVRDNQLYIFTHPEFKRIVRWRMENILDERNPDLERALGGMAKGQ